MVGGDSEELEGSSREDTDVVKALKDRVRGGGNTIVWLVVCADVGAPEGCEC